MLFEYDPEGYSICRTGDPDDEVVDEAVEDGEREEVELEEEEEDEDELLL